MTTELFPERLIRLAEESPDHAIVSVVTPQRSGELSGDPITLSAWVDAARHVAGQLADAGVGAGDRVLICQEPSLKFLASFSGAHWIGAIPVPLPSLGNLERRGALAARLQGVLEDCRPRVALAPENTGSLLASLSTFDPTTTVCLVPDLKATVAERDHHRTRPGDVAQIQYTSGSTGAPKGVVITHANLAASCEGMSRAADVRPDDRMVSWLPLFHDMGLMALMLLTWNRAWIGLMQPLHFLLAPASWLTTLSSLEATLTVAPNFAYNVAASRVPDRVVDGLNLSRLRLAFNGAEPVAAETLERFVARFGRAGFRSEAFFPVYGLAEATIAVTFPPPGRAPRVERVDRDALADGLARSSDDPQATTLVSVGSALPGHQVRICHPSTGDSLEDRRVGEIVVEGPAVSPGYYGMPPGGSALHTGDLGYLAAGELFVVDRLKDLVVIAGRNYAPADIERAAESVPGVRTGRVAACGVRDPELGTEALVVLAEGRTSLGRSRATLGADVRAAVTAHTGLEPRDVLILRPGTLRKTTSGKIQRQEARRRYVAGGLPLALSALDPRRVVQGLRDRLRTWFATRHEAGPRI